MGTIHTKVAVDKINVGTKSYKNLSMNNKKCFKRMHYNKWTY